MGRDAASTTRPPSDADRMAGAVRTLRAGGVVALHAGDGGTIVAQSGEFASPGSVRLLQRLSGRTPRVAITAERAMALGLPAGGQPILTAAADAARVAAAAAWLADPTRSPPQGAADRATGWQDGFTWTGHAADTLEGTTVRLAKRSGLAPSALVAALGRPVDVAALRRWAGEQGIAVLDAACLPGAEAADALLPVASAAVPLDGCPDNIIHAFRPADGGREHLAIVVGNPHAVEAPLVRLHSECFTGDLLGSLKCDCGDQLRGAVAAMAREGAGVLLYLAQEGRGIGLVNKLRAYRLQAAGFDTVDANTALGFAADERSYGVAASMLRHLGIGRVRLLTNNPDKVRQLAARGIAVDGRVPHAFPANPDNVAYLATKAARCGHWIQAAG